MAIERSTRGVAPARLAELTRSLLDASTLFALATVAPDGSAHVNTAYFAWAPTLELVWLSHPDAKHSQNIDANGSAAAAVYDSTQSWGKPDRGIQLFGSAAVVDDAGADDAATLYAGRFPDSRKEDLGVYRFYVLRPRWAKLFDERELGAAHFVIATVEGAGRLAWDTTEVYRA
jgi:uncharacterized protein YhbP (UPF0306 family)